MRTIAATLFATLCACAGSRMAPPSDVSRVSEVLPVSDRSRMTGAFVNEGFKLGPYTVADVDRKWDSSSELTFGRWGAGTKTTGFSFTLADGDTRLKGKCASELKQRSVLALGGKFDWGSTTLACECRGGEETAALQLSNNAGVLTVGDEEHTLRPVHALAGGGEQGEPSGFRADADRPVGAVEVVYPGQVWLRKGLDEATRGEVTCLFAGLMLYRPPSDD
jgi:hypothetical protein